MACSSSNLFLSPYCPMQPFLSFSSVSSGVSLWIQFISNVCSFIYLFTLDDSRIDDKSMYFLYWTFSKDPLLVRTWFLHPISLCFYSWYSPYEEQFIFGQLFWFYLINHVSTILHYVFLLFLFGFYLVKICSLLLQGIAFFESVGLQSLHLKKPLEICFES